MSRERLRRRQTRNTTKRWRRREARIADVATGLLGAAMRSLGEMTDIAARWVLLGSTGNLPSKEEIRRALTRGPR